MMEIRRHRYEGFDLATKVGWVAGQPGSSAIAKLHQGMRNIGGKFADSDEELRRQLEPLGVAWQGRAASGAGAAVTTAAARAAAHADTGQSAGKSVDGYGASFEGMRHHVADAGAGARAAEPGWFETSLKMGACGLLGPLAPFAAMSVESDYRDAIEQIRTLDARANGVLRVHEEIARFQLAQFPVVETVPAAVPPAGAGGGGGTGAVPGGGLGGAGGGGLPGGVGTQSVGTVGDLATPRPPTGIPALPDPLTRPHDTAVPVPPNTGGARVGGVSTRAPNVSSLPRVPDPPHATLRPPAPGAMTPALLQGRTSTGRGFADKLIRAGGPGVAEPTTRAPGREPFRTPVAAAGRPGGSGLPGGMYPPMAGAAGSRGGNDRHTPRYLVPSSAPFDVDTPHVAPVIGGEEQR